MIFFVWQNNPPLKSRSFSLASSGNSPISQRRPSQNAISFFNVGHSKLQSVNKRANLPPDHLVEVREVSMNWSQIKMPKWSNLLGFITKKLEIPFVSSGAWNVFGLLCWDNFKSQKFPGYMLCPQLLFCGVLSFLGTFSFFSLYLAFLK